jgi:hypothetical protein
MTTEQLLEWLRACVLEGWLSEDEAAMLLNRYARGGLSDSELPMPRNQAITGIDEGQVQQAIDALVRADVRMMKAEIVKSFAYGNRNSEGDADA